MSALSEYQQYNPPLTRQPDFDSFWEETLKNLHASDMKAQVKKVECYTDKIEVEEIWLTGFDNSSIYARYMRPAGMAGKKLPVVVIFHGYGWQSAGPIAHASWLLEGFAVLGVDIKGQGGKSIDRSVYNGPGVGRWFTKGIDSKESYYFRGVYADCVRAVDYVLTRDDTDPDRIFIQGESQGGGLTLATCALAAGKVRAGAAQIPFMCDFSNDYDPGRSVYSEIKDYLVCGRASKADVFNTLSFFDNLNLADRIRCPMIVTTGEVDTSCHPKGIHAVYNKITAPKELLFMEGVAHETPWWAGERVAGFIKGQL